jgi:hypothetical protein
MIGREKHASFLSKSVIYATENFYRRESRADEFLMSKEKRPRACDIKLLIGRSCFLVIKS